MVRTAHPTLVASSQYLGYHSGPLPTILISSAKAQPGPKRFMSRDYSRYGKPKKRGKQTTRRKPVRSKGNSGGMFWFVSGLAVGSLATAMVLVPDMRPEIPTVGSGGDSPEAVETYEPKFEFHNLLSGDEVVVVPEQPPVVDSPGASNPDQSSGEGAATDQANAATSSSGDVFLLQAGSFRSPNDAEERRVQLLLMNLTASIEKAKTGNGSTRYRVIVGPFNDRQSVNAALNRISSNGIETLLLKRSR